MGELADVIALGEGFTTEFKRFDEMPCERFDLQTDLPDSVYQRFAERAGLPQGADLFQTLENLHLTKEGKMTNAGAWLLTDDIRRASSSAHVSCALFFGHTKTRILDRKDFDADVYSNYQDIVTWLLSKLNTEFIIETMTREERPELPEAALREAVVNALAHRDYRSSANVQIYIFEDRLEIVSPGGLPAGMSPELLGIKSIPRNPLLFGMLYRMNAVEQVGSGVRRIREICRDYGVAVPDYDIREHWVTLTFKRPKLINGVRVFGESSVETSVKTSVKLLDLFVENPEITLAEAAIVIGKSVRAIEMAAAKLIEKEQLRHVGPKKGGHWKVLK